MAGSMEIVRAPGYTIPSLNPPPDFITAFYSDNLLATSRMPDARQPNFKKGGSSTRSRIRHTS
ncbi:MAG: hypothetical protein CSB22_00420 [Deltaproteobacteria bacterium]|nr:MAG: hypothetical protein CSB22_00420 [Deltaproteobacteria bacterium]